MSARIVLPSEQRKWTPEEVDKAIAFIKEKAPDVWAELERVEATTGDFRNVKEFYIHAGLAAECFDIKSLIDLTNLVGAIRLKRIEDLGLKPGAREVKEV